MARQPFLFADQQLELQKSSSFLISRNNKFSLEFLTRISSSKPAVQIKFNWSKRAASLAIMMINWMEQDDGTD